MVAAKSTELSVALVEACLADRVEDFVVIVEGEANIAALDVVPYGLCSAELTRLLQTLTAIVANMRAARGRHSSTGECRKVQILF